jgi:hypothetical protein
MSVTIAQAANLAQVKSALAAMLNVIIISAGLINGFICIVSSAQ